MVRGAGRGRGRDSIGVGIGVGIGIGAGVNRGKVYRHVVGAAVVLNLERVAAAAARGAHEDLGGLITVGNSGARDAQ